MDDRAIIWDAANRRHLGEDHPERHITVAEIEQALTDPERIEIFQEQRDAYCVLDAPAPAGGSSLPGSMFLRDATRFMPAPRAGGSYGGSRHER